MQTKMIGVLINMFADFFSYFTLQVKKKEAETENSNEACQTKPMRGEIKSLSTSGPGRCDTCHLTDFSQTFTDD